MKNNNTRLGFAGKLKDLASLSSIVTVSSDRSVLIENCRQICECSDIMAKVSAADYYIEVWGKDLKLSDYTQDSVMIQGDVESIKLISKTFRERREKK